MGDETEAVEAALDASDDRDLYEVSEWEVRSALDRLAVWVYAALAVLTRVVVVGLALAILAAIVALGGLGVVFQHPAIGLLALLSAVPALGLAGYVWYSDTASREPLGMLVATFLLGVLFANFAAVINTLAEGPVTAIPVVGTVVYFYVVVGPVEESVKQLAVRLHAYRHASFTAVVDGAVYGAMAGLGFATIENALYVSRGVLQAANATTDPGALVGAAAGTAAVRALAGPGHVLYSAYAGYYLGLAKFNPENRGPIVVKGLLVAAFVHATYNTLSGVGSALVATALGVPYAVGLFAFIVVYDGVFGYALYRKIDRYRRVHGAVTADDDRGTDGESGASADAGTGGTARETDAATGADGPVAEDGASDDEN
ncbi:MAG: PrsW family intramembrane metalloprotease [Halobacteriaceae archaeon]